MTGLGGMFVLVVEDEPIIALDLASMLEDAGAEVIGPAMTLQQADMLCRDERIALAILDVRLGSDTVMSVATNLADRGVPLLFHTGHATSASLRAQWPECRVLLKPAPSQDILDAVQTMLSRPEGSRTACTV
jgi:DNA-binding NtrC family response regulator